MAGSESVKKNEMTDILDPNVKSKPVLPSGGAGNKNLSASGLSKRLHVMHNTICQFIKSLAC